MTHLPIDRRQLLAGSLALAVGQAQAADAPPAAREFYELRRYRLASAANRALVLGHLEGALLPALARAGLSRIGVFLAAEVGDDHDVRMLLPFPALTALGTLDDRLAADEEYVAAAASFHARTEPVYTRVESRLLQAFASMPVIEAPAEGTGLFELRTYESVNADAARRKVAMFDEGETQLMRDVGLGPVFFGATRIGHDVPNLTYMLSARDAEAHAEHWKAFLAHPEWARIKVLPRYANTVSKITSHTLRAADCSQL